MDRRTPALSSGPAPCPDRRTVRRVEDTGRRSGDLWRRHPGRAQGLPKELKVLPGSSQKPDHLGGSHLPVSHLPGTHRNAECAARRPAQLAPSVEHPIFVCAWRARGRGRLNTDSSCAPGIGPCLATCRVCLEASKPRLRCNGDAHAICGVLCGHCESGGKGQ